MELLRFIEGIRSPFLDTLFGFVTRFGEETILVVAICVIYWCINKHMGYIMGISFFLSSLAVQGLKIVFRLPRPWIVDPTFEPVGGATRMATGYTFPSGHTQNGAAIFGSLGAQLKPIAIKVILFSMAFLVAASRLYLGVHFLSDVIASLIITFAIIWIALKIVPKEATCWKRELILSSVLVGLGILVIVIAAVLYARGISEPSQLRDSIRTSGAAIGFGVGMYIERMYIRFSVKAKNIGWQIVKFVLGLAGVLAIQEGVRLIGTSLPIDAVRYFLMVIWMTVIYPLVIKRFFQKEEDQGI
ncbi:MAG: phosphatase PAP2 family protein [Defluviitaleaceae bacterium]|nr:phosphatase PAP2 family protein [Defluviitaleaceae bacterium]